MNLNSLMLELNEYQSWPPGWDGHRGKKFSPKIITKVRKTLTRLFKLLRFYNWTPDEINIGPASDGSLDIEVVKNKLDEIKQYFEPAQTTG